MSVARWRRRSRLCGATSAMPGAAVTNATTAFEQAVGNGLYLGRLSENGYEALEFRLLPVDGRGSVHHRMRQAGAQRSGSTGQGADGEKGRLCQFQHD